MKTSRTACHALLLVACLALAGCRLDIGMSVSVDRDGSGRIEITLAADDELLARAEAAGARPLNDLIADERLRAQGWEVTSERLGSGRSVTIAIGFDDAVAFNALAADLAEGLAAPELRLLGPLRLELDADRVLVDGWASLEPTPAVAEHGLAPDEAVQRLRTIDSLGYRIEVTMPGDLLETTADDVRDTTASWNVAPGQRVQVYAVAVRPGPRRWPLVAAGALLVGSALALVGLRRRRRPVAAHRSRGSARP